MKKKAFDLEKSLKKIKDSELDIELLSRENEKLCHENNLEIGKLAIIILNEKMLLQSELKKSGEDKLECKLGSVSFNVMPDEWIYVDEILMAWIISLPTLFKNLYLKVTTTVKKGDLKKRIIADNEILFENNKLVDEPNELMELFLVEPVEEAFTRRDYKVQGITIKRQDPKFSINIKKKK